MYKGFTLIELLITLSITAILAAVAVPSYQQYITRCNRLDGQSALLDLAVRMELYYSENATYKTAGIGTGTAVDIRRTALSPAGLYRLRIQTQTDSAYTLSAIPVGKQAILDRLCQTLTLDSLGRKGTAALSGTQPLGSVLQCW